SRPPHTAGARLLPSPRACPRARCRPRPRPCPRSVPFVRAMPGRTVDQPPLLGITEAVSIRPSISTPVVLGATPLTLEDIARVARQHAPVRPGPGAVAAMARARAVVEAIVASGEQAPAVYGVNTGFGALAEVRISPAEIAQLQRNLVRSHAAGVGEP